MYKVPRSRRGVGQACTHEVLLVSLVLIGEDRSAWISFFSRCSELSVRAFYIFIPRPYVDAADDHT